MAVLLQTRCIALRLRLSKFHDGDGRHHPDFERLFSVPARSPEDEASGGFVLCTAFIFLVRVLMKPNSERAIWRTNTAD